MYFRGGGEPTRNINKLSKIEKNLPVFKHILPLPTYIWSNIDSCNGKCLEISNFQRKHPVLRPNYLSFLVKLDLSNSPKYFEN